MNARAAADGKSTWLARVGGSLALALVVLAFHGRSLSYGWFMDDYAHARQLRECDWSPASLTDACRLELNGGIIELWWLPPCTLRFFRPLAFAWLKLLYTMSDWSPVAAHAASLAWHWVACVLLWRLLRRLGGGWAAWAIAGLFAIHPGHVATVQWIAAQTELLVTVCMLAAAHLFVSTGALGTPGPAAPGGDAAAPRRPGRLIAGWVGAALLYALGLGSRENAIMLPAVLAGALLWRHSFGRRAAPGPDQRPRAAARGALLGLGALAAIAVVYLALRTSMLGGASLPPRPYVVAPSAPDFLRYVSDKAAYYLLGEFLLVPCVPIGGLSYFRAHPWTFYGATALLVGVFAVVVVRGRRSPAAALGPAWLLGFMLPVLPAFESPHHLYLPGVGWAILMQMLVQQLAGAPGGALSAAAAGARSLSAGRLARLRRPAVGLCLSVAAVAFGVSTHFSSLAFDVGQQVEDRLIDDVLGAEPPLQDGETLYFVNLPMIGHYVRLGVEERSGLRGLRAVALTWAPRLLGMDSPAELTVLDERTVETVVARNAYFEGPIGVLVREANGGRRPWAGDPPSWPATEGRASVPLLDDFEVRVAEGDDRGLSRLRFQFRDPLDHPNRRLFWGSRTRWAAQRIPDGPPRP